MKPAVMRLAKRPAVRRQLRRMKPETQGPVHIRLRNGTEIPVELDDLNGAILSLFGTNDPTIVRICRALLTPGDLFLDIGANYGSVGLQCVDRVRPMGEVHLLEANPRLARMLREAASRRSDKSVIVDAIALADANGTLSLSIPENHSGAGSIVENHAATGTTTVEVPARSAETYLDAFANHDRIGVKMDIEGAEPMVLPAIVRHPKVRFVLFESKHLPRDFDWHGLLSDNGFTAFGIDSTAWRLRLTPLSFAEESKKYHDIVAVRGNAKMEPGRPIGLRRLAAL